MAYEHAGHRKRMYEKSRQQALLDWEILEMILYPFIPRRNTVDLAHKLLDKFGSAATVFFASVDDLLEVEGIGESIADALYIMGEVYRRHFKQVYDPFAGEFKLEEFLLRAGDMYKREKSEVIDVYLLNERNRVISRHRRTDEKEGEVRLDTKWLGKLLSDEEVFGVVMVHNHPEGETCYSGNDELATRACQMVCNAHGKVLCDHVIFSKEGVYSYYKKGMLEKISAEYSLNKIVREKLVQELTEKAIALRGEAEALMRESRRLEGKENEETQG